MAERKTTISDSKAKLVLLDEDHSGRDEMNLAGNPFALLQAASKSGQTFIRREWPRTLANGKNVTATWNVNGDAVLGLPGPNEELLYLVLLQISREQRDEMGEWPQMVHFSRHDVLRRLKWQDGPREYKSLRDGFYRLQAVSIQSEYSFHDPRTGAPMPAIAFNLIDSFGFADEKKNRRAVDLPFSWFKWSDIILTSLRAGNVRSLALDFTLSLKLPLSRRLFRLLELLRHARKPALLEVKTELFPLRDRLGMTSYAYASKIAQVLQPAIEELVSRGYLQNVVFDKAKKNPAATFIFANVRVLESGAPLETTPTLTPTEATPPTTPTQLNLLDAPTNPSTDQLSPQEFAQNAHAIFAKLPPAEQSELLEAARREVSPIWHDRVGQPDSPMSLGLWELVADKYPETLKKE